MPLAKKRSPTIEEQRKRRHAKWRATMQYPCCGARARLPRRSQRLSRRTCPTCDKLWLVERVSSLRTLILTGLAIVKWHDLGNV